MITETRIREIKRLLRKGFPEGEIKEMLKKEGYSQEDINKAFVPHDYDMRSWYLVSAIVAGLLVFWVFMQTRGTSSFYPVRIAFFSVPQRNPKIG